MEKNKKRAAKSPFDTKIKINIRSVCIQIDTDAFIFK